MKKSQASVVAACWRRNARQLARARCAAAALARIGSRALRGRHAEAAELFLRTTYTYPDGAWDAFLAEWRRIGR